jgi:mitochondrial fission protein ELM1
MIISCGSSIAPVNFALSRENLAKSIVIMRPSVFSVRRFDLVVMPWHDRPPRRKNVVVTDGALNLINEDYLKGQSEALMRHLTPNTQHSTPKIGLLIGGDAKNFHLEKGTILEVIRRIKSAAERLKLDILVTTSRRTPENIEGLVKEEFKNYPYCKLLIIANEENPSFTVGGILGLSQIIVSSPESISMISEAVSGKKYVLVFQSAGLDKKHDRFLKHFAQNKYIYLTEPEDLSKTIIEIWEKRPLVYELKDDILVKEAIKKIL